MNIAESNEKAWDEADDFESLGTAVQIGGRMWPSVESFEKAVDEMSKEAELAGE